MAPQAGARCARHPELAAVDLCQRCGTFLCGECVHIHLEDVYCAGCSRILDRPAPGRPKLAFGLAAAPIPLGLALSVAAQGLGTLVGLVMVLPLTGSALALILQERAARRGGQAPRKGRFYPLTWLMLALDLAAVAGLALLIALQDARP